jgi:heat shock protein HtpX
MKYIGIHQQQKRNNFRSILLLLLFPCLVVALTFVFSYLFSAFTIPENSAYKYNPMDVALPFFLRAVPYVIAAVLIWFLIAYFANTSIINSAIGSATLDRKDNKRVYNLVENLCMSQGMSMPKINVIEDASLNAFASGINKKTYTVTLTRGIINKLDDRELEGVIAHELSHIRNRDVRLLIVSIVFVGIFSMIAEMAIRMVYLQGGSRSTKTDKGNNTAVIMLIALVVAIIGYIFSLLMRFAISRKREYLADAGAAQMTKNPLALASALQKISQDPEIETLKRDDIAQLFIDHPKKKEKNIFSGLTSLFATHPPIKKRIQILEQF